MPTDPSLAHSEIKRRSKYAMALLSPRPCGPQGFGCSGGAVSFRIMKRGLAIFVLGINMSARIKQGVYCLSGAKHGRNMKRGPVIDVASIDICARIEQGVLLSRRCQSRPLLCKSTKTAIGFHSFGFLIPRIFIQFARLAGEELQRFAMNFWVDQLASSVSISGRCLSSWLLPGPFCRPTGRPVARLAQRTSFVRAEINPRLISVAIENTVVMNLLWMASSKCHLPLIV